MERPRLWWVTCLVVGGCVGCGLVPATQVLVHVDAIETLRADVSSLRLQVTADGTTTYDMSRDADALVWPATLPITSAAASEASFRATATLEDGRTVSVSAHVTFSAGERRELWLWLHEACIDVDCGGDLRRTCWDGSCTDACFSTSHAPPSEPAACETADGGVPDAGCSDEGTPCSGGTCRGGACCTGCWDGSACVTTGDAARCGAEGAACAACPCDGDRCVAGACAPATDRVLDTIGTWFQRTCASVGDQGWCWGQNNYGQVGVGTLDTPSDPRSLGAVGRIDDVRGPFHTCSSDAAQDRWCWGQNSAGQLGSPAGTDELSPRRTEDGIAWVEVVAGFSFTCGRSAPGGIYCWGSNQRGALATDPAITPSSDVPLRVSDASGAFLASRLALGTRSAFAIHGGVLVGWGSNLDGRGILALDPEATASVSAPRIIELGEPARDVWAGDFGCAIGTSGRGYIWGEAGPGSTFEVSELPEPPGARWDSLSPGAAHLCGIDSEQRLWCWGEGGQGQLGDGRGISVAEPIRVIAPDGADRFSDVSAGAGVTCAIAMSGAGYCWGAPDNGVLGFAARDPVRVPTRVCLPPR